MKLRVMSPNAGPETGWVMAEKLEQQNGPDVAAAGAGEPEKPVDARFTIHIRADRMAAELELLAPARNGGAELTLEKLKAELVQRKVVFGFDDVGLERVLLELAGNPGGVGKVLLAEGQPPQTGGHGRLEVKVGSGALNLDPAMMDLVRPGQVVVLRIKAGAGEPGRNVFGEEVPAKAGQDSPLVAGDFVRYDEEVGEFVAETYGRAVVGGGLVTVTPLVEVAGDGMSAWLPLYPRVADDTPLTCQHLEQGLQAAGVVHGIMTEAMAAALEQGSSIPRILAAKGDKPVDGRDARIEFRFSLNDDDPLRVDAARHGTNPPPEPVRKSLMLAGELLAEKEPPEPALPGRKVTGETIAGREPRDILLSAGANVEGSFDGLNFKLSDGLVAGYPDLRDGELAVLDPVQLSEDEMIAWLEIHPPARSGRSLSGELLIKMLAAHDITHGVRKNTIRQAVEFAAAHKRVLPRVVAARGREAVNGRDAAIEILFRTGKNAGRISAETEQMDFRERNTISAVKKGDVLARRTPPEPGVDGWTVRGMPLTAKPGADLQFQPQPNVEVSGDGLELISTIDGMLTVLAPNKIAVFEVFEVKGDVDYRTGNLEMVGALLISGWVRPGFTVRASGDIRVGGGVEDAGLLAGANVAIAGGMVSRGRGRIRAQHDVVVKFLEWTRVHAGGNILVHDQIMRSYVFACGTIDVSAGRGRIRGGVTAAIQGVTANEIGSPAGVQTVVMAGANPALRRRLLQVNRQLAEYTRKRVKMDTVLGRFLNHGRAGHKLPPETQRKLSLLAKQRRAVVQAENRLLRPREEMARELAAIDLKKIRIIAKKSVYAGTVVVIGRLKHKVREDLLKPVTFMLTEEGREINCRS